MKDDKELSNLYEEDALEPDLPICDPHHHLWDRPGTKYMLEELYQDIGKGHKIVQTVFVECCSGYRNYGPDEMKPLGETEFVRDLALLSAGGKYGETKVAAGIVGHADLRLGSDVASVLEAHLAAGQGLFRGIRHSVAWSPQISGYMNSPQGLLLDSKFQEGFACLKKYDLSFDAWLYHPQLMELAELASTFPDVPIIIDHLGGPLFVGPYAARRKEVFEEWKRGTAELAKHENLFMKLGGLGMPNAGFFWYERPTPPGSAELAEAMAPFYLWCIEQFGVDRCMFESNFPVDKVSYSYVNMWNAFKRIVKDFSPREKAALFHDTAVSAYRLAADRE